MAHVHTPNEKKPHTPAANGCCQAETPPAETCCELICFERPNYFCGHLLTDDDLRLEQKYVREKLKLYHRTLDAHGIVCGLRLKCDSDCGHIWIEEGYAIDDCGNDLVVCQSRRFDVVSALKKKRWLLEEPAPDPCKPAEEQPDCVLRQCFYITACYEETQAGFTTPFVAGCRPGLSECEPTRIREGVRFDVLDRLPEKHSWLDDLRERIESCFAVFSEGPFAKELAANSGALVSIVEAQATPTNHQTYWNLFCALRAGLLLYLRKHPDAYNCGVEDRIRKIPFPTAPQTPVGAGSSPAGYAEPVRDAFCALLEIAWQYAVACAFGELAPRCPGPSKASCVVLGTVEVENGKVVQVCNCPREYVWSFAHFFEVLLASIVGNEGCETKGSSSTNGHSNGDHDPCADQGEHVCCRDFELDCACFLQHYQVDKKAASLAGTEPLATIERLRTALRESFNFTDACKFSPRMFRNSSAAELPETLRRIGLTNFRIEDAPATAEAQHIFSVVQGLGLAAQEQALVFHTKEGVVKQAAVGRRFEARLDPEQQNALEAKIQEAESRATLASEQAKALEADLAARRDDIIELRSLVRLGVDRAADAEKRLDSATLTIDQLATRLNSTAQQLEEAQVETESVRKEAADKFAEFELFRKDIMERLNTTAQQVEKETEPEGEDGKAKKKKSGDKS